MYISDKCCSSELSIRNLKIVLLSCFQHNTNNIYFWEANKNIRIISEGSCDWSNDAKHSAWNHRNKLHFKIYSNRILIAIIKVWQTAEYSIWWYTCCLAGALNSCLRCWTAFSSLPLLNLLWRYFFYKVCQQQSILCYLYMIWSGTIIWLDILRTWILCTSCYDF